MASKNYQLPMSLQRKLVELGERIGLARLRRRISAETLAQRMGVSRNTLRSVERGTSTSLRSIAMALFVLGLDGDIDLVARDDLLGRKLQDIALGQRVSRNRSTV